MHGALPQGTNTGGFQMLYAMKVLARANEASLKDARSPDFKVKPGEKVVGVLPDDLKKLYMLMDQTAKKVNSLNEQGMKLYGSLPEKEMLEKTTKEASQLYRNLQLENSDHAMLEECFWTSIRRHLPETADISNLGLRENWQIVEVDMAQRAKHRLLKTIEDAFDAFGK